MRIFDFLKGPDINQGVKESGSGLRTALFLCERPGKYGWLYG